MGVHKTLSNYLHTNFVGELVNFVKTNLLVELHLGISTQMCTGCFHKEKHVGGDRATKLCGHKF